jgi:hypothetical protein
MDASGCDVAQWVAQRRGFAAFSLGTHFSPIAQLSCFSSAITHAKQLALVRIDDDLVSLAGFTEQANDTAARIRRPQELQANWRSLASKATGSRHAHHVVDLLLAARGQWTPVSDGERMSASTKDATRMRRGA